MREIIPLKDQVLIQPDPATFRGAALNKPSLIIMPEQAEEPSRSGKVLAVGPGKREDERVIPLDVKPGDRVLFPRYAGVIFERLEFNGEFTGLRLMKESEIEVIL